MRRSRYPAHPHKGEGAGFAYDQLPPLIPQAHQGEKHPDDERRGQGQKGQEQNGEKGKTVVVHRETSNREWGWNVKFF